jgi:chromosome segregation ATPase
LLEDSLRAVQIDCNNAKQALEEERVIRKSEQDKLDKLAAAQKATQEALESARREVDASRKDTCHQPRGIPENATDAGKELQERCLALESELRKSKRREEKLQALQYRLQMDIKECGGSLEAFKNLRDVRSLEYELDRTANRAEKEIARLRDIISKGGGKSVNRVPLEPKPENIG